MKEATTTDQGEGRARDRDGAIQDVEFEGEIDPTEIKREHKSEEMNLEFGNSGTEHDIRRNTSCGHWYSCEA
jgi:hypothetical protein